MGIGRIVGAAAPIAAGYFGGPAMAGLTGGLTSGAIAAGALTGAGIAALSGEDVLTGGVMGGLGGFSGGSLANAAQKTAEIAALKQAGAPTMAVNKAAIDAVKPQGMFSSTAGVSKGIPMTAGAPAASPTSGMFARNLGVSQPIGVGSLNAGPTLAGSNVGGGGYMAPPTIGESTAAAFREPGEFLSQLGDGSKAMGAGKLGITGLGVAGQAGAFDPEPIDIRPREEEKYDPNRRLNLSMDTGISKYLGDRDTGLRLLAKGGEVKKFAIGGMGYGLSPPAPPPEYGIIDVGGKFVKTSDKPGPGLISDSDFKKQYQTTTAEKNQQAGGGGGMDPNLNPAGAQAEDTGMNPGAISALAAGFAQQQMNPPTKAQALGLEALARGGYLETGGEVGDGMSDEIEATIEGTQEARLSDGEFVIPADVVSHLGNGSSDAGARRLYEMMDKVRMARTGNKKQGKEIKPERYMPA